MGTAVRAALDDAGRTGMRRADCGIWTEEPGLFGVGVTPPVGIGQRGLIVTTGEGNLLWDPPGYLDAGAIEQVRQLGGLRAVTASHPHFYGAMAEWGRAFGAGVWVPEADAAWVTLPDSFDRIYGGWAPTIRSGARAALETSAERYIQFLRGQAPG